MNLRETALPIEVYWTTFATLMILVCGVIFIESLLDLRAAYKEPINVKRRLAALRSSWMQLGFLAIQVYAAVAGGFAVFTPSVIPSGGYSTTGLVFVVAMLAMEAAAATAAIGARFLRYRLDRAIDRELDDARLAQAGAWHAETMAAIVETRQLAQEAYKEANNVNTKITEANVISGENSDALRRYLVERQGHDEERSGREHEREDRREAREDTRGQARADREIERDAKIAEALIKQDDRRDRRERNR